MAPGPTDPVTADDVHNAQFALVNRKGGYDTQEVDAFLDLVAATLDANPALGGGELTGDDVRLAQFDTVRRGGYNTSQVDTFLDRVAETFSMNTGRDVSGIPEPAAPIFDPEDEPVAAADGGIFEDPDLAPAAGDATEMIAVVPDPDPEPAFDPAPETVVEPAAVVEAEPVVAMPEPAPVPLPEPVVDPEPVVAAAETPAQGAGATPHLHDPEGAAQRLLAAAQLAADRLTADAETYAAQVRAEADEYAAATRSEADDHAAQVTGAAEAQAAAIREVAADEARRVAEETRDALMGEISSLEQRRTDLEATSAALQTRVETERARALELAEALRVAAGADSQPPEAQAVPADPGPDAVLADVDHEVAAAFDDPSASVETAEADPEADPESESDAADVDDPPQASLDLAGAERVGTDPAAAAATSVFDLPDDGEADTSVEWIDEEPAGGGVIFDLEADDGEPAAAPVVESHAGERFFDELRQAEEADGLGPLDDDTDAALSAFFDGDEADENDSRWRDRFGPGRS